MEGNVLRPIDCLYQGLRRDPAAIAVETGDVRVSYAELVSDTEALATAFQELDGRNNSRVGICAYNTREHLTALLATYAAGKVWVPLNPRNGKAELDAMIAVTQPGIIVAGEACLEKFTPTGAALVVADDGADGSSQPTVAGLVHRFRGRRPAQLTQSAEDTQVIKFSGGTTGKPKGVLQSVRCINAQAANISRTFAFAADDANLIAAPLTHGTSCFVLPILAAGGRHVFPVRSGAEGALDAIVRHGVTTLYAPPTLIHSMVDGHMKGGRDANPTTLRHLIYSAAPMSADRIRETRDALGPVVETAYGQVEAPQIITAMRAGEFDDERNLASVGRAVSPTQVEIMDPRGELLAAGELGEVVVRGDLVMSGYLDRPDLTAQTIVDGWLHTGDLGVLDERGYLYLKSRLRDVIISGGFNVFPADVEAVLSRHAAIAECSVFGMDDPKWGEAVHAAVRLHEGMQVSEAELIQFVKTELDSVKAPKRIHVLEELPRTAVGKVSRNAVRDKVLGLGNAYVGR